MLLALVVLAAAAGCGAAPGEEYADLRRNCKAALDEAETVFAQGNFEAACQKYDEALQPGGLNPDLYVLAVTKRAVCWGYQGKFDEAFAALDEVAPGAANLDMIYAARSFLLRKQGKIPEAKAAWGQAKRINRSVEQF